MNKREDYERILLELKSAQNEEEVIDRITRIVKSFSPDYYKNDLYENPYFKSLIPDITIVIISELQEIRITLKDEIKAIEDEIFKLNSKGITSIKDKDISQLRDLKKECILLIKELDERIKDLIFLK